MNYVIRYLYDKKYRIIFIRSTEKMATLETTSRVVFKSQLFKMLMFNCNTHFGTLNIILIHKSKYTSFLLINDLNVIHIINICDITKEYYFFIYSYISTSQLHNQRVINRQTGYLPRALKTQEK